MKTLPFYSKGVHELVLDLSHLVLLLSVFINNLVQPMLADTEFVKDFMVYLQIEHLVTEDVLSHVCTQ
jgi:hypothetical protein